MQARRGGDHARRLRVGGVEDDRAPVRSVTAAPARSQIRQPAAMSHSQVSRSVSIPSNRPSATRHSR